MGTLADATQADRLIKLKEVMYRTSLGSSTIYRRMVAGAFPKPLQLSEACVRWRESDIDKWTNALPVVGTVPA